MIDVSFSERLSQIGKVFISSPFFIALFIIVILSVAVYFVSTKKVSKLPKYLVLGSYAAIIVFVFVKYGTFVSNLQDSFINKLFTAMYFPNLITYLCILIISIFILAYVFINNKASKIFKGIYLLCFGIIWVLFVLVLDVVKNNDIDIYDKASVYGNEVLLILLQATTYVFFAWIGIMLFKLVVDKITEFLTKHRDSQGVKSSEGELSDGNSPAFENNLDTYNGDTTYSDFNNYQSNGFDFNYSNFNNTNNSFNDISNTEVNNNYSEPSFNNYEDISNSINEFNSSANNDINNSYSEGFNSYDNVNTDMNSFNANQNNNYNSNDNFNNSFNNTFNNNYSSDVNTGFNSNLYNDVNNTFNTFNNNTTDVNNYNPNNSFDSYNNYSGPSFNNYEQYQNYNDFDQNNNY